MPADLQRLIAPRSIALIGASAWTDAVADGNAALGYQGTIRRVHPTRTSTAAIPYYRTVEELPEPPDAAFIAVPNREVCSVARALAARGAGGFVCFTAGFSETGTDLGLRLTHELSQAAGALPFFGPNCYGFVNFFDRVALLPDQVVGATVTSGVALICQSGTIALTLMFNRRSVPIGGIFTVGNQTCLAVEDLIETLCDDPRITAFGLYLEGVKDADAFARAIARARAVGKPIAIVKAGRTAAAARTAHSHTGALAGEDAVFDAFCEQAGIARCDTLATLCEILKVLHTGGVLGGRKIVVMGASGGDMAMTADVARALDLEFAAFPVESVATLRLQLGDRVAIANPFDFHTYLWFDPPALGRVFDAVFAAGFDTVAFMLDRPPEKACDVTAYDVVIDEFLAAARGAVARGATARGDAASGVTARAVLIASLPETLSEKIRVRCFAAGVVPLQGQREALEALALADRAGRSWLSPAYLKLQLPAIIGRPSAVVAVRTLNEVEGKLVLAAAGVTVPRGRAIRIEATAAAAVALGFPVVIKAVSSALAHKTEQGGVVLNVRSQAEAGAAAAQLAALSDLLLVEEMITDGIAEILVGVVVDRQFGQVLVVGAGGVLTELLADSVTLLPPWTRESIGAALQRLASSKLLKGFRGRPAGDIDALVQTIVAIGQYATANRSRLVEIDVNPLIVRPAGKGVVAVDAMIRLHC